MKQARSAFGPLYYTGAAEVAKKDLAKATDTFDGGARAGGLERAPGRRVVEVGDLWKCWKYCIFPRWTS